MRSEAKPIPRILVIDDDPIARRLIRGCLSSENVDSVEAENAAEALSTMSTAQVVCLDLGLPDMSGLELLKVIRGEHPEVPVIVVTGAQDVETAVEAMRLGAYDYVTKPVEPERFRFAIRRATGHVKLSSRLAELEDADGPADGLRRLIGDSRPMNELRHRIERVVDSRVGVAILGESGSGKELVARALHDGGSRRARPFVAVNCAAIPETLLESELFGHEKGAFTGANSTYQGRFEQAEGGTLFLDEVGELSASCQATLLRVLQERTIRRVGGKKDIAVDVRVVCATHRDLEADVTAGKFREDLYYRLVVYPIATPPLRERKDDVPGLVAHFIRELSADVPRLVSGVEAAALDVLRNYSWPGNVRELRNAVHAAMLSSSTDKISVADLPTRVRATKMPDAPAERPAQFEDVGIVPLAELEQRAIRRALEQTKGNVAEAARALGLGRATLYRRLARIDGASA